jgi:16S rRNA (guanine527-N7)-methyltransferase
MANKQEVLHVSRETNQDLKLFEEHLLKNNSKFNLISKFDENILWERHFLDSIQVIDSINKNTAKCVDLGSGAGFPGIVLAIEAKNKKYMTEFILYEKSFRKAEFLEEISEKLKLNTKIITRNLFEEKKITGELIFARAFKPLPAILQLIYEKAENFKELILFLGKSGRESLIQTSKNWHFEYKQRKSKTSDDSLIININKIKKIE